MVAPNRKIRERSYFVAAELPQPPRFIGHQELRNKYSRGRIIDSSIEEPKKGRRPFADELILFKQMHCCGYLMSKMWDRLENLSPDEQKQYLELYKQYTSIRDQLVNDNMGLVFDLLSRNRFTNVEFEELRSEGLMALLRALDTYNPWSGYRFSTYACNSILRAFSRVAVMQSKRRQLWMNSFEPELEPAIRKEPEPDRSLDIYSERLVLALQDKRTDLSETERFVLDQRFPLEQNRHKATLKSVGAKMKISKERVRQIQKSALVKLHDALINDPVLD